jgi:hypothetical protein
MKYILLLDQAKRPHWNSFNSMEAFKDWYSQDESCVPRRDLFAIAGISPSEEEIKRLWDKYDASHASRVQSHSLCSKKIVSLFEKLLEKLDDEGRLYKD